MSQHTRQQVAAAVQAIENKKGEDVVILEMDRNAGAFTDYFVLCTGTNPRQIQTLSDEVEKQLGHAGARPNSVEGYKQAEWVLLDYVDFVVHIFSEKARKFYDLERLWKSATRLKPADLLKKFVEKKPAAKRVAKRPAAARAAKPKAKAAKRKAAAPRAKARPKAKKKARKRS